MLVMAEYGAESSVNSDVVAVYGVWMSSSK
jgi:hypothetical protein